MIWIKICGTTNLEDALASVEAGADALGFIFAPSPRRISPKEAAKIIRELPAKVEKIGVFVNQKPEIILDTVEKAGLTGVQLQGDEKPEIAAELKSRAPSLQVIKTLSMSPFAGVDRSLPIGIAVEDRALQVFNRVLLDSGTEKARGGTGKRFDWVATANFARLLSRYMKVIIAGGLNAANVQEAIQLFRPFGVDVASGVEREPGKKDQAKLKAFVQTARKADSFLRSE